MERLTTITGQANSLQSTMSNSVEILGEQITNLEGRMHRALTDSNPEIISSLQRIESKLASSRIRAKLPAFQGQHGHSGSRYYLHSAFIRNSVIRIKKQYSNFLEI